MVFTTALHGLMAPEGNRCNRRSLHSIRMALGDQPMNGFLSANANESDVPNVQIPEGEEIFFLGRMEVKTKAIAEGDSVQGLSVNGL